MATITQNILIDLNSKRIVRENNHLVGLRSYSFTEGNTYAGEITLIRDGAIYAGAISSVVIELGNSVNDVALVRFDGTTKDYSLTFTGDLLRQYMYNEASKDSIFSIGLTVDSLPYVIDSVSTVLIANPSDNTGGTSWDKVTGKPATFTPSAHTQSISSVDGLQDSLNAKAGASHNHVKADITDLSLAWADVSDKPTEFTPSAHNHIPSDTLYEGLAVAGSSNINGANYSFVKDGDNTGYTSVIRTVPLVITRTMAGPNAYWAISEKDTGTVLYKSSNFTYGQYGVNLPPWDSSLIWSVVNGNAPAPTSVTKGYVSLHSVIEAGTAGKVSKVSGKALSTNDYTTTEKNKLSGIEAGAQVNTVTSIAGRTGAVTLSASDVGLGNVDNTSDANKPVSTAQQTALNLKANLASPTFTGTVAGITKAMVGLGNVDNTADASKPVSTAQQAALDLKANIITSPVNQMFSSPRRISSLALSGTSNASPAISTEAGFEYALALTNGAAVAGNYATATAIRFLNLITVNSSTYLGGEFWLAFDFFARATTAVNSAFYILIGAAATAAPIAARGLQCKITDNAIELGIYNTSLITSSFTYTDIGNVNTGAKRLILQWVRSTNTLSVYVGSLFYNYSYPVYIGSLSSDVGGTNASSYNLCFMNMATGNVGANASVSIGNIVHTAI